MAADPMASGFAQQGMVDLQQKSADRELLLAERSQRALRDQEAGAGAILSAAASLDDFESRRWFPTLEGFLALALAQMLGSSPRSASFASSFRAQALGLIFYHRGGLLVLRWRSANSAVVRLSDSRKPAIFKCLPDCSSFINRRWHYSR